ncbi:CBS domain-containing protein [Lyngbya aestuarii]|uniref:CBS domain-containing protein n=1 Tax=Lyngbya aestuarii TaxID=118322 RepID=UPI00403DFA01
MDLILCHTTADFDALGAAVGLTRLKAGAKIVLTGGAHPAVRDFLALHRDEYSLIERRAVNTQQIQTVIVVDSQKRDRLGKAAEWLDLPQLQSVEVYDHHLDTQTDIPATHTQIEPVGATTTLITEQLQQSSIRLTTAEATVMALGIHVDTGSLTFESTTPRDAAALTWLMQQGAALRQIATYVDPGLSPRLQELLKLALGNLQSQTHLGYTVSWVILQTSDYVPGLSSLVSRLMELTESDALLLASEYRGIEQDSDRFSVYQPANPPAIPNPRVRLTVIGRSRIEGSNLNKLFEPLGGGGHSQAASVTLREVNPLEIIEQLVKQLTDQIPQPLKARDLMSSPVRTIRPETTISEAQRILLRYGHSGLSVVDETDQLVGVVSRRDIDLALHHGFAHAPVKGYMSKNLRTINPETSLQIIESIMVTYDIGRLPVLEEDQLVGIVTRTDVLRQLHQDKTIDAEEDSYQLPIADPQSAITNLRKRLDPQLWQLLSQAAEEAHKRGWHLYLVGGAVRDLLLADTSDTLLLKDIDLVVDGFHRSADTGAGVALAQALQQSYPGGRLEVHGAFQTAALLWHNDPVLKSLWIDIATARTEFYPYPAANPEVEASSIRQDLYRRDFTINALAVRLTPSRDSKLPLLDFFGGLLDLRSRLIRVLHANSFIEDPTRIYRAVRFAVRLGFKIEPQTEAYIKYAIESGVYERSLATHGKAPALQTRLKAELKHILQEPYWESSLQLLASLEALRCIHPSLKLNIQLWWRVRLVDRWLRRFDPGETLKHWQMRLEVLIAHLAPEVRALVASNLQLTLDSIERLQQLAQAQKEIVETLPKCQLKSEIVEFLRQYDLPTLVLIAVQNTRTIRRKIWQYLTTLADVEAPLNGNDLRKLGYKPGPQYREMLDALLAATLDEVVRDKAEAQAFLDQHFPLTHT